MCLLDERLATEHQGVVKHTHSKHGDACLLHQHGARAQQQTDNQKPHRDCGRQRVLRDTHTHTPDEEMRKNKHIL